MEAIKFDEKSLSRFPVAFYFSAVEAFDKRIMAADCGLDRFREMREKYDLLFKAFDEAYKRTNKSELTAKIAALVSEDLEYFRKHAMSNPNANKKKKDISDTDPQPDAEPSEA